LDLMDLEASGSDDSSDETWKISLKQVDKLTDEEVSEQILRRLEYGTTDGTCLEEDLRPLKQLFEFARASGEDRFDRQVAVQAMRTLGFLKDPAAWSKFRFALRGYIRLRNRAGAENSFGEDTEPVDFFELLSDIESYAKIGVSEEDADQQETCLELLWARLDPVFRSAVAESGFIGEEEIVHEVASCLSTELSMMNRSRPIDLSEILNDSIHSVMNYDGSSHASSHSR
jgi:hypothetical protein